MGAAIPAARSSLASRTWATASHAAPASTAARATGTAPCPYPSAFTTAHTWAGAQTACSVMTLAAIASSDTSAHDALTAP